MAFARTSSTTGTATAEPLKKALGTCKSAVTATAIFSFCANILLLVSPLYMMQVYDRVLSSRSVSTLVALTVIVAFLLAIMGFIEAVRSKVLVRAGTKLDMLLSPTVFRSIFDLALKQPGKGSTQVLRDMDQLRDFATGPALVVFCDAPWAPLFIILAFILHPLLGFLTLAGGVIIFALALMNELTTRKQLAEATGQSIQANALADAALRNAEVMHSMGMLKGIATRWQTRHQEALAKQTYASDRAGLLLALSKTVRMFLQSAILGTGAYLALSDLITGGAIMAASIIMGRALAPIEGAVRHWRGFVAARGSWERLNALLAATDGNAAPMTLPRPKGNLALEKVFVTPPANQTPVVKGVSFELKAGEVLGIVGPSAAGKSSLARAMIGVWPASDGVVRLDGADLKLLNRDEVGPALGYLPQEVELLDGSVAENICRFSTINPQKIVEAAMKAGVHEMILALPQGYDTPIGNAGRTLSGGQRQRIALARAIYDNPAFVVLDEPNSNLDTLGEEALVRAVSSLKQGGTTTVVVTHRISILATVDKILLLNNGEIELFGPRDEVLSRLSRPQIVKQTPDAQPDSSNDEAQAAAAQGA